MHLLVLSAFRPQNDHHRQKDRGGLNAPSGAQCFPTSPRRNCPGRSLWRVSMHLLVLSAFRRRGFVPGDQAWLRLNAPSGAQCFPTREIEASWAMVTPSQCTFWCSVLSDRNDHHGDRAPFESQCTFWCSVLSDPRPAPVRHPSMLGLNAPSGAQCFPTPPGDPAWDFVSVSMHLLVLSAFRRSSMRSVLLSPASLNAPSGAQCFPT